ncbi:MAG: methyltransferase domain-containing protein [Deltaproteobacteria bacterium]|nr:methyltransferase domain-containing protein [Deltaproteobacteria bacterium]
MTQAGDRQDLQSREYWDGIAAQDAHGSLHGLLERDEQIALYRDRVEKRVLYRRAPEVLRARRALEVGCGGGRWTVELAARCEEVLATDISAAMVQRARDRVASAGLGNVTLQVAAFHEIACDGSFDLVYLGSCLHYIDDEHVEAGLRRLDGLAAPDAILLSRDSVSLIGRTFRRSELFEGDDPAIYRPVAWYEEAMARHGWTLADSWRSYTTPLFWTLRGRLPRALLEALARTELWLSPLAIRCADLRRSRGSKEHRFFLYRRRSSR